jgi:hypothetical protein
LKNLCIDRYHKIRDEVNLIFFIEFSREERVKFWRHKCGLMANEDLFLPDKVYYFEFGVNCPVLSQLRGAVISLI